MNWFSHHSADWITLKGEIICRVAVSMNTDGHLSITKIKVKVVDDKNIQNKHGELTLNVWG